MRHQLFVSSEELKLSHNVQNVRFCSHAGRPSMGNCDRIVLHRRDAFNHATHRSASPTTSLASATIYTDPVDDIASCLLEFHSTLARSICTNLNWHEDNTFLIVRTPYESSGLAELTFAKTYLGILLAHGAFRKNPSRLTPLSHVFLECHSLQIPSCTAF